MLSKRTSKAAAWFVGMVMTAIAMACAIFIGPGDFYWFLAISVVTGLGIGADYGLPPSILADVINSTEGGDSRGKTGTYFGLWALATKLATAIGAAGSLPVAAMLGFNPAKGQYGTTALIIAYIVLPVLIKIVAALLIWFIRIEAERGSVRDELLASRSRRGSRACCGWRRPKSRCRPQQPCATVAKTLRKSTVCLRSPSCRSPSDG